MSKANIREELQGKANIPSKLFDLSEHAFNTFTDWKVTLLIDFLNHYAEALSGFETFLWKEKLIDPIVAKAIASQFTLFYDKVSKYRIEEEERLDQEYGISSITSGVISEIAREIEIQQDIENNIKLS